MTGRRNKRSQQLEPVGQSRRSERVKKKLQRAKEQKILGVRKEVHRPGKRSYQFSGYPKLSSSSSSELKTLLESSGLEKYYSILDWDWTSYSHIQDFFLNSIVVKEEDDSNEMIIYYPLNGQYPLLITVEKLASALHLSLGEICPSTATAARKEAKADTRFKLHSGERYFPLGSAETETLFIAGKFASEGLFLQQNRSHLSFQRMKLFRAALNGKPVPWGQVLWQNLVKRTLSFEQQASRYGGNSSSLKQKLRKLPYEAVVLALLLRVPHGSEHEGWFQSLCNSRPKGSCWDESDHELLIDVLNNRRKKAKVIKEETSTDEDPICNSRFNLVAEDVRDEETIAGTEDFAEEAFALSKVLQDTRLRLSGRGNLQSTISNLVDMYEKDEEDVSIGESETDDAVPHETHLELECRKPANSSDVTTEGQQDSDVHQLSSGNDSPNAPASPERFNVQSSEDLEDDVDLAIEIDDQFPRAAEVDRYSKQNLKRATAESDEEPCSVDLMVDLLLDVLEFPQESNPEMSLEMVNDGNQISMPTNVPLLTEFVHNLIDLERGKKQMPRSVNTSGEGGQKGRHETDEGQVISQSQISARGGLGTKPRLMTDITQFPSSTLVKMVHIVKHFIDGLDEAGVPANVYMKLKAGKLMDALKLELENRELQEFSEQTEFYSINWSMDKIFEAHWFLQDLLRKSQMECSKLQEEVEEIFTEFSANKHLVSLKATNSIKGKVFGVNDQDAEKNSTVPLFEVLKILKDKMKDVKEGIKMMEVVTQRHRKEWLKQRSVLVQRWNDMKFENYQQLRQIEKLEENAKLEEDTFRDFQEKLQKESTRRSRSLQAIKDLQDEIHQLEGALNEKTDEILHTLKEKHEVVQGAKLLKEKLSKSKEELQRKEMDLINAMAQINDLKQTAETMSDRLKAQNDDLNEKNDEVRYLKNEIARWMDDSSACKLEKETLSTEMRRVKLQMKNQIAITQEMDENNKELQDKLNMRKDRIQELGQLVARKDQEIDLLKSKAETTEKILEEYKRAVDMAHGMVQKQRAIQDTCKRQIASLKEDRENIGNQLDRVLKRESRLLKELEEEKEKLEDGLLDQEQQNIWSIEEITENQTAAEMRSQVALLQVEKKEIFASASQRVREIIDSYKLVMISDGERSSASSAG